MKNIFGPSHSKDSLGSQFRKKRFSHFKNLVSALYDEKKITYPVKVLDIGGLESYWTNLDDDWIENLDITIMNLDLPKHTVSMKHSKGDATNLSDTRDQQYDLVFSNSVIEHLFSWDNQSKMAKEAVRVGKYYYIQTPNKYFFLEPHYLLPFFQFLPKKLQLFILTKTYFSRMKKWEYNAAKNYVDEIELLSKGQMKKLFPTATLYSENFLGMSKSFIAHNLNQ